MNNRNDVIIWLKNYFLHCEYIKEVLLIGSFVNGDFPKSNDIDIVVTLNRGSDVIEYASNFFKVSRTEFKSKFSKALHITSFTSNEEEAFKLFMSKNRFEKIL